MKGFLRFKTPVIGLSLIVLTLIPHLFLGMTFHPIALLVILLGFVVMLRELAKFRKEDAELCPTGTTARIITNGIYRFSRNPMYLGMTVILLGYALLVGSVIALVAPIVFYVIINNVFIPYEEEKIKNVKGYKEYRKKVRRWV